MSTLPLPIAAFAAGLVSFLTPCVLPLIPGYISLISGVGLDDLRHQESLRLIWEPANGKHQATDDEHHGHHRPLTRSAPGCSRDGSGNITPTGSSRSTLRSVAAKSSENQSRRASARSVI
jgi:Cytochrome C biogenesis protein transmembrane region